MVVFIVSKSDILNNYKTQNSGASFKSIFNSFYSTIVRFLESFSEASYRTESGSTLDETGLHESDVFCGEAP